MEFGKINLLFEKWAIKTGLWLFFIALVFFPLTQVQDYLTNGGWFYFLALSFLFTAILAFTRTSISLPSKNKVILFGIYLLVLVLSSIINKATFLEERWVQRYSLILFSFLCLQIFRDEKKVSEYLKFPLTGFLIFLCFESIYQYVFICGLGDPLGRSCYASRLWNINMLGQALALSMPFLFLFRKFAKKIEAYFFESLIVLVSITILIGACRSAILSLLILLMAEFAFLFDFSRKRTLVLVFMTALFFFPINSYKNNMSNSLGDDKKGTANYRLEVWKKSFQMAYDFPTGVGVNNFEFGFLPYKKESTIENITQEVDKSPHNEFVRVLSEEGWIVFFLFLGGILSILFIGVKEIVKKGENTFFYRFLLCLLPELFFQFPTEMSFPVFLFSIALAIYLKNSTSNIDFTIFKKVFLVVCVFAVSSIFFIRDIKVVPAAYSAAFCRAFPDNWKMCGEYFKEHFDGGDVEMASSTIKPVIVRQPFNFIALHFDYLLGDSERNKIISCNYFNLFNGKSSIPESNIEACGPGDNRQKLLNSFIDYAKTR